MFLFFFSLSLYFKKNIKDENTSLQKIFGESLLKIIKEKLLDETILGQFIPLIKEFLQSAKKKEDGIYIL